MGLENLKSAFNDIASNSQQIGGRHGGLTGETPSQPPHQDWHSLLDDINPYTNQFIYGYQYKNPNKGGLHGANIDFNGTPVLSTPFYEIENMTSAFGMIGSQVNFLSRLTGTNSYMPPVGRIPGFNKNFDIGGYTFANGQIGNSKYIGIQSNHVFNTPDNIYDEFTNSSLVDFPSVQLSDIQIHPIANDLVQLNQYNQMDLSDIIDNYNILPESTKLFDNYNYDPRLENMYFGKIVPILNINSYNGSQFDDNVGGLFNTVQNTSDSSKKYSNVFRTINIPDGFMKMENDTLIPGGQVFTEGNISTGQGFIQQNTAFEKFKSAFELGAPVKYSPNPNTFELNLTVPNTPATNDFVEIRQNTISKLGEGSKIFETLYTSDHKPTDNKYGPGNVKAKLSLQNDAHNSGYRGTEPYVVSDIGNDNTKNSSRYWQLSRSLIDEKRIFEFMKSEAGLWFMGKQNLLGLNTRVIIEDDESPQNFTKATGQRFKRWYSPVSTLASAFRIGGGGFPNVLVDREFPLGELAGMFGAATNYISFIKSRKKTDRNYDLTDSITQPQNDDSNFLQQVGQAIADAVPGLQGKPKDPPKLGDKMTLTDYLGPMVTNAGGAAAYGAVPSTYKSKNPWMDEAEKSKNGMPFYFRDMRTNKYLVFRAYLTAITENIQPSWNSETYIGSSEPVYVYDKTERDISFTLTLHAGTSSELEAIYKKMNLLTSLCYPEYKTDVNFVSSNTSALVASVTKEGKNRMKPPLTMMRMGELYGSRHHELMGFIKSLNFSFPDNATWETKEGKRVPKLITVAMSYQVTHASVPGIEYDESLEEVSTTKFFGYAGNDNNITSAERKQKIQPDITYKVE